MQHTIQKFYSSLGLLIFLNVIIKPLWIFGVDRQVQNAVGMNTYGTYFSLFNLSIVFSFLLDWGLTTFFNRQLASKKENFIDHAGSFLLIKLLFAGIYIAIVFLAAWFADIKHLDILLSIILIQVFTSLFIFFRGIITSLQWFHTDAWLSVLDKTLMIFLCGSLLYFPAVFGTMTIYKFLFTQVACTTLAMLCALGILFRRGVRFEVKKYSLNKNLLSAAIPFAVIMLLMSVHYRLDGFLLERMYRNGAYEAGVYAAAYRLLDASNMVVYLFAYFLLPYITKQWSEQKDIQTVILASRHLVLMFSITIAVVVFFLAPWIQHVLYHHNDVNASEVLQWCLPALIGYSLVHIYGTTMAATGYILPFCYITLIAVVINIGLNFFLIPSLGAKGCCIAALVSQWFCGFASMQYINQKMGTSIHLRSLLIYIFTAVILSTFFYWSNNLAISKWLLITAAGMITLLMMLITKLFSIKMWIISLRKTNI
jgi:O-antigen/teichoic acid export membrane protein